MFIAESSTYLEPVKKPSQLLDVYPELSDATPDLHLVTVKTCSAPSLLSRCLSSLNQIQSQNNLRILVTDDSPREESRQENAEIAQSCGATYCATAGELSLISSFANYLHRTKPNEHGSHLVEYLQRITRDSTLGQDQIGCGPGGAQNVSHLLNAMVFGEQGVPRHEWLSTFIDDDVVMPSNAEDIFTLIGMYHKLGRIGFIASNYLHHSGNPTTLTASALRYLVDKEPEMSDEALEKEINNILNRVPTVGLRDDTASDALYSTPTFTLTFPLGNYSLSGEKAFDIPIPTIGMKDLGYRTMLLLFIGANRLGVARVPDFLHIRTMRPQGGDAVPQLLTFYQTASKEKEHLQFEELLISYAVNEENIPPAIIENLKRRQSIHRMEQLRQIRLVIEAAGQLATRTRLTNHATTLKHLKVSARQFANVVTGASRSSISPELAMGLIKDMRTLHPQLIEMAFGFGADGELEKYAARHKNEER